MRILAQLIDDKRLLEPPEPWRIQWWWLLAAAALVLGGWAAARHYRAKQKAKAEEGAVHQAELDALAELERLFALVDREESRPYAIESSAIIRRYIEARFELSAPTQSTEEFLAAALNSPRLDPAHQQLLGEFLRVCDLLKFARTLANRTELGQLHEAAVRFVKETQPAREVAA
jgi:hypothetical protein